MNDDLTHHHTVAINGAPIGYIAFTASMHGEWTAAAVGPHGVGVPIRRDFATRTSAEQWLVSVWLAAVQMETR